MQTFKHCLSLIVVLTICGFNVVSCCFPYVLPWDKNWPSKSNFIELRNAVQGRVVLPNDIDYKPHTWNRRTNTPKPAVIVHAICNEDVIEALKFAQRFKLRLSVMSTGHHQDQRNIYDNGVHLDMSQMNAKKIDLDKRTLTLGPGNNFRQIHKYVSDQSKNSLVALGGADPGVGIYGWTVGGGHGSLTRQYGLGVDSLISIDIILANSTLVTASETRNKELFRALRGSGGSAYGVAVSLTIKLFDDPGKVSAFTGLYELSNKTSRMFAKWIKTAPDQAMAYYLTNNLEDNKFVLLYAFCFANSSFCSPVLSVLSKGCITSSDLQITCKPSLDLFANFYDFFSHQNTDADGVIYLSSTALNSQNVEVALQEIDTFISNNNNTGCYVNGALGGASRQMDPSREFTSVSPEMRNSIVAITCFSAMQETDSVEMKKFQVKVMDKLASTVFEKYSKWVYWNEPQHNFAANDWKKRYWGGLGNYNRLLAVKREVDATNFFNCYHCIGYERYEHEDPSVCPQVSCTCSNTPYGQCASGEYMPLLN